MTLTVREARDFHSALEQVCYEKIDVAVYPGCEPNVTCFIVPCAYLRVISHKVKKLPGYKFMSLDVSTGNPVETFVVNLDIIELTKALCTD